MPNYEFQCDDCGEYSMVRAPMNSIPYTVICRGCGNEMRRLYSVPQITILRGAGEHMDRAYKGLDRPPDMSKEQAMRVANSMKHRR